MINTMVVMNKMILDSVAAKAKTFLADYIDADYKSINIIQNDSDKLVLSDYAVAIYVHGKLNFTIMMSFEENLVKNIAHTFLDGEKIEENEKPIIYNSVAKETINIITGLSLSSFTNSGNGLDITTPTKVNSITIKKFENVTRFSEDLITKFGKLSISIINYNKQGI